MHKYALAHHSQDAPDGQHGFFLTNMEGTHLVSPVFPSFVYLSHWLDKQGWIHMPHIGKGVYGNNRRKGSCPTGEPRTSRNIRLSDPVWDWLRYKHPDGAARAIENWYSQETNERNQNP